MWWLAACGFAALLSPTVVAEPVVPRFKWGQTKEKVFVTVAVKDLDQETVTVNFAQDTLSIAAADTHGKPYGLDLKLAQDVDVSGCHWEHLKRRDRWGTAVLATLQKAFPEAWATLVTDPAHYRQVMDRDWTREDEQLGSPEEDPYFSEHARYLPRVTAEGLAALREGVDALVVNVRHLACGQCKTADETFAKLAVRIAGAARSSWQSRLRMAVVDARRERGLTRRLLGSSCAGSPRECRYFAFGPAGGLGGDEAVPLRGRHQEPLLEADLKRLTRKLFAPVTVEEVAQCCQNSTRGLAVLSPSAPAWVGHAAHRLRLQLDLAVVASVEEFASLAGSASPAAAGAPPRLFVWPPGEAQPSAFTDATSEALEPWLRARAVAPLAATGTFEDDEPYEDLGLPLGRLFLRGGRDEVDEIARETVRSLARRFTGRVAFVVRRAAARAYDWRNLGLPPDRFPGFGLAMGMEPNATKFAFLGVPHHGSSAEFWAGPASGALEAFLEDALAGRLEPSIMSEAPPDEEGEELEPLPGRVHKLVGRRCRRVAEESQRDALIEAFDEWRRDHAARSRQVDVLATLLARWNVTVYRLDYGYNECPRGTLPPIAAGYSGYFWVPRRAKERKKSWQRLKKLDPPLERVLSFVRKHSQAGDELVVQDLLVELNATVLALDRKEAVEKFAAEWGPIAAAAFALAGLLGHFTLRRLASRRQAAAQVRADLQKGKSD